MSNIMCAVNLHCMKRYPVAQLAESYRFARSLLGEDRGPLF
jgi:hypothetical protein